MSLDAIRDKELVSPGCNPQMQLQAARQDGMQRDCPDEAALALMVITPSRIARSAVAVSIRKHSWMRRPAYRAR